MLNACVSHELRNPLNSIRARNLEKMYLYNLMRERINENMFDKDEFLEIIGKLDIGCVVQQQSCSLMITNVQDLLDYAQINA